MRLADSRPDPDMVKADEGHEAQEPHCFHHAIIRWASQDDCTSYTEHLHYSSFDTCETASASWCNKAWSH